MKYIIIYHYTDAGYRFMTSILNYNIILTIVLYQTTCRFMLILIKNLQLDIQVVYKKIPIYNVNVLLSTCNST
jgi:hypothetical protein